jgi:hypothetical protein
MIDLYLRASDQAEMDAALSAAGLIIDGEVAPSVCIDRIGPFDRTAGYDENDRPIFEHYADYHANVRLLADIGDDAALADILIARPHRPVRIWLS